MATIKLEVRGTGYIGGAGHGNVIEASTTYYGDHTEQIYYRNAKSSGVLHKLLHPNESAWVVESAYITPADKANLAEMVSTDKDTVERGGMSSYVLYGSSK